LIETRFGFSVLAAAFFGVFLAGVSIVGVVPKFSNVTCGKASMVGVWVSTAFDFFGVLVFGDFAFFAMIVSS